MTADLAGSHRSWRACRLGNAAVTRAGETAQATVPDLPDQRTALELVLGRRGWGGGGMSRWRDSGGEPEVRGADADNAERNADRGEADRHPKIGRASCRERV